MNAQVPSVGRIVHYVSYGTPGGEYQSVCRAAVVTQAPGDADESVHLCVINPEGLFFNKNVRYSEDHEGGSWHFPERVGP